MTGPSNELIVRRLDELSEDIKEIKDEDLKAIKEQVTATNGRVRTLELWQARLEGAKWAVSWLPSVGTGLIVGLVVAVATHLLG